MECYLLVGELGVNIRVGLDSCFDISLVLGIKINLKNSLSINLATSSLSNNLSRVNNIVKDSILYSSQSAAARANSRSFVGTRERFSKNSTLGDDDNLTSAVLLLKFTDKTNLNLVEAFEELVGNVKDDGLASSTAVNLFCGSDVKIAKSGL